jgi:hypothetical protein
MLLTTILHSSSIASRPAGAIFALAVEMPPHKEVLMVLRENDNDT